MFCHLSSNPCGNSVILWTNDTDCLIIGLSAMEKLAEDVDVRIEAGVQSTNSQQCISLNPLYIALGKRFFQSLPGYRTFTQMWLHGLFL